MDVQVKHMKAHETPSTTRAFNWHLFLFSVFYQIGKSIANGGHFERSPTHSCRYLYLSNITHHTSHTHTYSKSIAMDHIAPAQNHYHMSRSSKMLHSTILLVRWHIWLVFRDSTSFGQDWILCFHCLQCGFFGIVLCVCVRCPGKQFISIPIRQFMEETFFYIFMFSDDGKVLPFA